MNKYIIFTLSLLALCSCQKGPSVGPGDEEHLASAAENDCGFVQNAYGQRVSWKKNIPITLQLHKGYPLEYEDTLKKAAHHWDESAGMTLFRFVRTENLLPETAQKDTQNTVHWLREWSDNQKNMQGLTNLYWKGTQIYESDVAINNKYFNFFIESPTTPYDVHLESLLIHELGHVLGLKHRSTIPSVMWSVLSGAIKRDTLTTADRETIKCEY
ncbi:MAG: matrixin family metalloprotease [Bdellovibrio sp.]|nr:matrixin family metalloprotease [Bdellovibrio sp.]